MSLAKNLEQMSLATPTPAAQDLRSDKGRDDEKIQIDRLIGMSLEERLVVMSSLSLDEQIDVLNAMKKEKWKRMRAELSQSKPKEVKEGDASGFEEAGEEYGKSKGQMERECSIVPIPNVKPYGREWWAGRPTLLVPPSKRDECAGE